MKLLPATPALAVLLFVSCNGNEQEPSVLHVDDFLFEAGALQGTSSENITELWVYEEGTILGVYDLPAQIPVLSEGNTALRFFAGIKNNGISSTRITYPFYTSFDTTIVLSPLSEHWVEPAFSYVENLDIDEMDFEDGVNEFFGYGTNQGIMEITETDVFEGDASARALLEPDQSVLLQRTEQHYLWDAGDLVFLEMNYSCNNSFSVGLYDINSAAETKNFAVILNPTTTGNGNPVWKKIYIDLGFIIQQNADADYFELYFESIHDESGSTVEIFLDNLKLVEFE